MYSTRIKKKQLSSGGTALVTTFPAHGAVSFVGSLGGGSLAWGSDEVAKVHAEMLLEGTQKRTKRDIQVFLDSIGASLSFDAGKDRLTLRGRVRRVHFEKLLALICEALETPVFPEEELALLKKREEADLALEVQDTRTQAAIAFSRALFAPQHPNHANTTEESRTALADITSRFLREKHLAMLDARELVFSVAGDITPAQAFPLLEKYTKKISRKTVSLPKFSKALPGANMRVAVPVKNKASIDYMCGSTTGITNAHKDYPALLLGMQILGNQGGFSGRLMKTVREEEGLTYGVYAYLRGFSQIYDGSVAVWGTFAPGLFARGRKAIAREIKKIITEGVTAEEVQKHREMYASGMQVRLSTSGAFASAAHDCVADDKPLSYLDAFPKTILGLTAAQVNRVLKKYLLPNNLSEVAAGPVEKNVFKA